jgi:proteasome lid subunit RPN8/RPN11
MKLRIPYMVYRQLSRYVEIANGEIGGMGKIVFDKGETIVNKVYLLEQEVSSVTTDIDASSLAKLMYEARNDEGAMNFWWHSHVNMGVTPSSTDKATLEEFGRNGFFYAFIINKKGDMSCTFYSQGDDTKPTIITSEVDVTIDYGESSYLPIWDKEVSDKCKARVSTMGSITGKYLDSSYSRQSLLNDSRDRIRDTYLRDSCIDYGLDQGTSSRSAYYDASDDPSTWDKKRWEEEFFDSYERKAKSKREMKEYREEMIAWYNKQKYLI